MKLKNDQIAWAKSIGCLLNRGSGDRFNARVLSGNGVFSAEQLVAIGEAARRFGDGRAALTTRLTIEISGVPFGQIEPLQGYLAAYGLKLGGTGAKVRPVTACKGTTCIYGLVDTQGLAQRIHEQFYEGWGQVSLPHKFKIAVGGCPNNCMKPDLNDFGLIGQRVPRQQLEDCRSCKVCNAQKSCAPGAARCVDGKITFDAERCDNCGKCVDGCPFPAVQEARRGLKVVLGGRWGRQGRPGRALPGVYSEQEALELLECALLLFRREGYPRERFGDMLARIGFEQAQELLLSRELLAQKDAILAAPLRAREAQ